MHGQGTFFDPRLNDAAKFPIAAREGFGNVRNTPDLITAKLPALHLYQLAIPAPKPPEGSFDRGLAAQGKTLFEGKAKCATSHVPPLYTEPGWNMHTAEESGIDDFQAKRSPDERLPHGAAAGPLGAPEGRLLPRRPVRDAPRRPEPLRRPLRPRPHRRREAGARGVPEVAVTGR
jgi:hypothetical protein